MFLFKRFWMPSMPIHVTACQNDNIVQLRRAFISENITDDNSSKFYTEIGVGLTGFGITFLFLGILMFFDRGLLAIGNILFVSGLTVVIGLERTSRFFFQKHKLKGTAFFFGGIVLVLFGWPFIGMLIELYGFFLLFSGFLPVAVNFLRRLPVIGHLLNFPGIRYLVNLIGEPQGMV